jgi:hypothetical protein
LSFKDAQVLDYFKKLKVEKNEIIESINSVATENQKLKKNYCKIRKSKINTISNRHFELP